METLRPSPQVSGSDLRLNWSSSIRSSSKRTRLDRRWLGSAGRTRWRPGDATNCSVDGSVYQPSKKVKINIDNMYNRTARRYGEPWMGAGMAAIAGGRNERFITGKRKHVAASLLEWSSTSSMCRCGCGSRPDHRTKTRFARWSGRRPERRSQLELLLPEQD
jgi:hypothetical protein